MNSIDYFGYYGAFNHRVDSNGSSTNSASMSSFGVRPAIVLKPGIEIAEGDGTYNTPYVINTSGN